MLIWLDQLSFRLWKWSFVKNDLNQSTSSMSQLSWRLFYDTLLFIIIYRCRTNILFTMKGISIFQLYVVRSGQCDLYGMLWFSISSQIYPTVQLSRCCYTFVYVNDLFDHDIAIIIMRKFCLSLMCIAKRKLFK